MEFRILDEPLRQIKKVADDLEAKLLQVEDRGSKLVEAVVQELVA